MENSQGVRIHDLPDHAKPRERLVAQGVEQLASEDLIAILLRTGTKGRNVIEVARELIANGGHSLSRLARVSIEDLRQVRGVGRDKAATLIAAFELARRMATEIVAEPPQLDSPEAVANHLRHSMLPLEVETFFVLMVNTRRRLVAQKQVSQGTLDTLLVHPREVFKSAISANASAIVIAHNHPSGDPTPSEADIRVTRDLIRAGQLLKIELLDHIILGHRTEERPCDYVSLRELGYFYT